jgi:hypothetical protein
MFASTGVLLLSAALLVAFLLRRPLLGWVGFAVVCAIVVALTAVAAVALDAWRPLVDGSPRIARERFSWERDAVAVSAPVTEKRATP